MTSSPAERGWVYLDLPDYLVIAESVLGIRAEQLARIAQLHLAASALDAPAAEFGGVEFYPDFAEKAAVLCTRLARNHALPDGNKRVAYISTIEFVERNGFEWTPPAGDDPDGDETVHVMEDVAAGNLTEEELAAWIRDRIKEPQANGT